VKGVVGSIFLSLVFLTGCPSSGERGPGNGFILMCSTVGPVDAGIVQALEEAFERESGIRMRHISAGTGAALAIARGGSIDLVMAHAKSLEEKFVSDGFGTERIPLMYNDFVLVGPANDPAGVRGAARAVDALRMIAAQGSTFISRGDRSGTHIAEMDLWVRAGIKPAGDWYTVYERGAEGNGPTLRFADRRSAYTVMDRATYLKHKKRIGIVVLVEKDSALLNRISLIPVNPSKVARANYADVMSFVRWACDPNKGQRIIANFGTDTYGEPLYFPDSREWVKSAKGKPAR